MLYSIIVKLVLFLLLFVVCYVFFVFFAPNYSLSRTLSSILFNLIFINMTFRRSNSIWFEKYLISSELHVALLTNTLPNNLIYETDNSYSLSKLDFYIVNFRIVLIKDNKGGYKPVLMYKYLPYNDIFADVVLYYLISRHGFYNSITYGQCGNLYTIVDSSLGSNNELITEIKASPNQYNEHLNYRTEINNMHEYLDDIDFSKKFVTVTDINNMCNLLNLLYNKDSKNFITSYLELVKMKDNLDFNPLSMKINIDINVNLLNSCVFIVKDFNAFIKLIRDNIDKDINQGPQPRRGCLSYMDNINNNIDTDFRNCLIKHNNWFSNQFSRKIYLNKDKFSFQNVHMNLGNVRWYSTKRKIGKDILMSPEVLISRADKSIEKDSLVFNHLADLLKNSPVNEDTQLTIENFLYNLSSESYHDKKDKDSIINYNLINNKLSSFLVEKESELNDYINILKSKTFNKIPKSDKLQAQYYLNLTLKELDNIYIISVMYGRLLRIISKFNRLNLENKMPNTCIDIGNDIVGNYFYNLYYKQMYKSIKIFVDMLNVYLNTENFMIDDSIKLLFDKVKKIIKKKNPDKSNLIYYTRILVYKVKEQYKNNINTDLTNIMKDVNYTLSDWYKDNDNIVSQFNDRAKNLIGYKIIDWMSDSNLVLLDIHIVGREDKYQSIKPSNDILNLLKDTNKLLHLPRKIPMIIKPKPYYREKINDNTHDRLGGYLLNDQLTKDNIIKDKWNLEESSNIQDKNLVFDLVNNISSVGFKINKDVLNFIKDYGIKYDLIIDKKYEDPLLIKPKLIKSDRIKLEGFLSKKVLQENILGLAKVFSMVHEFFIPVRLEFRGRMNCVSEYLNYQSSELAKSLLLFSKPEKILKSDIKAIGYFKAYGANCFGNKLDKKSWNDRIKWIDNNEKNIINFKNGILITQAENKLLFIAFCFEYNRWLQALSNNNVPYFDTYLPIQLDATCNGYQHLALLSLDYELGKELNLTKSTWDDNPKDFYNYFTIKLIKFFKDKLKYDKLNVEDYESYSRLSKLDIQRALVKLCIMTKAYNATVHGMIKDLLEHFEKCDSTLNENITDFRYEWYQLLENTDIKLRSRDITYIATAIDDILKYNVFKLGKLFNYLNDIAEICTKLEIPITWTSPSGVVVRQSYLVNKEVKLKPFTYSKNAFSIKIPQKSVYNKRKQKQAFMPNFVHSLDSAALALLVDFYFNGKTKEKSLYAIHDCFAVTANNVENLIEYLKLVYIKIYSEKQYLKELDNQIKSYIKSVYKESFNEQTGIIKTDDIELQFPNVEYVLGTKLDAKNFIRDSSYLIS